MQHHIERVHIERVHVAPTHAKRSIYTPTTHTNVYTHPPTHTHTHTITHAHTTHHHRRLTAGVLGFSTLALNTTNSSSCPHEASRGPYLSFAPKLTNTQRDTLQYTHVCPTHGHALHTHISYSFSPHTRNTQTSCVRQTYKHTQTRNYTQRAHWYVSSPYTQHVHTAPNDADDASCDTSLVSNGEVPGAPVIARLSRVASGSFCQVLQFCVSVSLSAASVRAVPHGHNATSAAAGFDERRHARRARTLFS
jgi:hypothetical protein